jgi:putative flippase GtrA
MIAMLGSHKTNHVCVPLNYKLPKDKIQFCIEDSNVGVVFCDTKFRHLVPEGILVVEFGKDFDYFVAHNYAPPTDLDPDRLCLALYTSGTTGAPKKIMFSFNDRFFEATRHKMLSVGVPKQKVMSANPLFHNAGINWFVSNILRGNTIFVPSHFDSKEFLRFLLTGGIAAIVNFLSRIIFNLWFDFSVSLYLAFILGMVTAFFLKKQFVFAKSRQPLSHSIGFFILVNLVAFLQTLAVAMALLHYVLPYLGIVKMTHEIAHAIGIMAPIITSYFGHKRLSFR